MLDSLSLDNDEDHLSDDSDSDTPGDGIVNPPPPCQSDTSAGTSDTSESAQKDGKPLVLEISCLDSSLSSKEVKWNSLDRCQRGLFKSCVVDVSTTTVPSAAQSAGQESLSGSDNSSIQTVPHTCNSQDLSRKFAEEQTTLERVKKCMYEWKTTELVAFLYTDPAKVIHSGVSEHENVSESIASVEEMNRNDIENSTDSREETVKQYERKVGEFYGAKPRVRFADSCKQVSMIMHFHFLFESLQK